MPLDSAREVVQMDVFEYLQDERQFIEEQLFELVTQSPSWSRDRIFEKTTGVLSEIKNHVEKQQMLLIDFLGTSDTAEPLVFEWQKRREKVIEVLETLEMLHVDEPDYRRHLTHLLKTFKEQMHFSKFFCDEARKYITEDELDRMNCKVREWIHNVPIHAG